MPVSTVVPAKGEIVRACRARANVGMAAIGGFPPADHFVPFNKHRKLAQNEIWLVETLTMEPPILRGPKDGGGVTVRGIYILTWYGLPDTGEDGDAKLDELLRLYFSPSTSFLTAPTPPKLPAAVHVRGDAAAYVDGPNNVNAWAVSVGSVPWYVLARNAVIP